MALLSHVLKVTRLEALTDGVFAIAMTILVLDLRLPHGISNVSLLHELIPSIFLKLFVFIMSFVILGTLWIAMNFQLGFIESINRYYFWTHILYLMIISVVPFSATLVTAYPDTTSSVAFFSVNLLCASACQYLICICASHYDLNKETYTKEAKQAIIRRIYIAPIFYGSALILSFFQPSFAFVILVVPTLLYLFPSKIDTFDRY